MDNVSQSADLNVQDGVALLTGDEPEDLDEQDSTPDENADDGQENVDAASDDDADGDGIEGEADADQQEEAPDEDEPVYIVKIDGEEHEVKETELLQGYQREQDYRRKTQSLADQRREFEQHRQAEVEQLRQALSFYALPTAKEPRPEDFVNQPDPNAAFVQAYGQWQQQAGQQAEAAQYLEAITAEEHERTLQREAGLLQQAIPEWKDEEVRQADYSSMMEAASNRYGFTQEEVASVTDHRLLLLLRDASRVAALEAKPIEMKRKTEVKPKLRAGAKENYDREAERNRKAMDRAIKTGSIEDAAKIAFD